MHPRMVGRMRMAAVALMLALAAACGNGDDTRECHTCNATESCDGGQECVLATDGAQRCFDLDRATCPLGRVDVGRASPLAPTPTPTATP
jgi:hypothetical protein